MREAFKQDFIETVWRRVMRPLLVVDAFFMGASFGNLVSDARSWSMFDDKTSCSNVLLPKACQWGCQNADLFLGGAAIVILVLIGHEIRRLRHGHCRT